MVHGENDFAFLTSLAMTTFVCRLRDTMFVSHPYTGEQPVLLAMVCWMVVSIAPELMGPNFELQVPNPEETKIWRRDHVYDDDLEVGVAHRFV